MFNGRTPDSGSGDRGSTPWREATVIFKPYPIGPTAGRRSPKPQTAARHTHGVPRGDAAPRGTAPNSVQERDRGRMAEVAGRTAQRGDEMEGTTKRQG